MSDVKGLLKGYEKQYKSPVGVMGIRDDEPTRLQTGMFTFDLITGGGIPEGRMTLIYGHEAAMKTTMALKMLAAAQRKYPKRTPAFMDVEGHLDRKWAKLMGVDVDRMAHIIPQNAEQAVDIAESLMAAQDISLIVFDSLAALQTQSELEKSAEDAIVGRQALAINRFYRKATHALNNARTEGGFCPTLVLINQVRFNLKAGPGQDPELMPGGPAFKFASSLTVRLNGSDVLVKTVHPTMPAYRRVSCIIKKNKVPVVAKKGELQVALMPIPEFGLKTGELYAWNTVLSYLKSLNLFTKPEKATEWELIHPATGEVEKFKVQDDLKTKLRDDIAYATTVYEGLIRAVMNSGDVVEAE